MKDEDKEHYLITNFCVALQNIKSFLSFKSYKFYKKGCFITLELEFYDGEKFYIDCSLKFIKDNEVDYYIKRKLLILCTEIISKTLDIKSVDKVKSEVL